MTNKQRVSHTTANRPQNKQKSRNNRPSISRNLRKNKRNSLLNDNTTIYDITDVIPQSGILDELPSRKQQQLQYNRRKPHQNINNKEQNTMTGSTSRSKFDIRKNRSNNELLFDYNVLMGLNTYFVSAGYMNDVSYNTVSSNQLNSNMYITAPSTVTQQTLSTAHTVQAPTIKHQSNTTRTPQSTQLHKPSTSKQRRQNKRNNDRKHTRRVVVRSPLIQHQLQSSHADEQILNNTSDDEIYDNKYRNSIRQQIIESNRSRGNHDNYIDRIASQIIDDSDIDSIDDEEVEVLERAVQASLMDHKSANQWNDVELQSNHSDNEEDKHSESEDNNTEPNYTIDTQGTHVSDINAPSADMSDIHDLNDSSEQAHTGVGYNIDDDIHIDSSTASNDDSTDYSDTPYNNESNESNSEVEYDEKNECYDSDAENELYDAVDNDDDVAVLYHTYSPLATSYTPSVPGDIVDAFPIDLSRTADQPELFGAATWAMTGKISRDDTIQSDDSNSDNDDSTIEYTDDDSHTDYSSDTLNIDFNRYVDIDDPHHQSMNKRTVSYPTPGGRSMIYRLCCVLTKYIAQ